MPEITFIDESWTVDASASDVFALLEDVDGWPEWASQIKSASRSGNGELSPGDTLEFTPDLFLPLPLKATIKEVNAPDRISWGVEIPGFRLEHRFELHSRGESCEVHQFESAEGLLAPATLPLKGMLNGFDRKWGDDLVDHFRSGNP